MANITLTVKQNGVPLPGADVIVGDFKEKPVKTDENGQISSTVAEDFAMIADVAVKHANFGIRQGIVILFEAGGNYVIDIKTNIE